MALVGGNDVFLGKTVWGAVTYIRILTDQRYVPDFSGSSAKMAQKWAEMAFFFFKETVEKDVKK